MKSSAKRTNRIYHLTSRNANAFGRASGAGDAFTVLAGSYADYTETTEFTTNPDRAAKVERDHLIANGTLEKLTDELSPRYRLTADVTFNSTSMAASVMSGQAERGPTVWREL